VVLSDAYFRKLLFENEKFGFRRVVSKKICGHAGENLLQSILGEFLVKITRMK